MEDEAGSGWQTVAGWEETAPLFAALVALDPGREYARSDLAEAADVALKSLYLGDALETLVEAGVLERVDGDDEEATYVIDGGHQVLEAARAFDDAVATALE